MSRFGNLKQIMDGTDPNPVYMNARGVAGLMLQEQFDAFNENVENIIKEGVKWVKPEHSYPAFDHLSFSYKKSIFSIIIELIHNEESSLTEEQKEELIQAAEDYNLIPCLYKIRLIDNFPDEPLEDNYPQDSDYQLVPLEQNWNLYDIHTNEVLDPIKKASDEDVELSEWEFNNFANQVVRDDLEANGFTVFSFCDLAEFNPQIWFEDKEGNVGWIFVEYYLDGFANKIDRWKQLDDEYPSLKAYNGYVAKVEFIASLEHGEEFLRGDNVQLRYEGYEKVHDAE